MKPSLEAIAAAQRSIAQAFRVACIQAGVTQQQIADAAGKSSPTVYQVVRGERRSAEVVAAIRKFLPDFAAEYFPLKSECDSFCKTAQDGVGAGEQGDGGPQVCAEKGGPIQE